MLIKSLINLGLILTPFFIWQGYSSREPKMALAVALALALGLLAVYEGKLKAFRNKWVLFFLGYMLLNFYFAPKPEVRMFDMNVSIFWVWRPMFVIMCFALMLFTISSLEFTQEDRKRMLNIMVWSGFIISLYMFVQRLGFDQWFMHIGGNLKEELTPGNVGATLGNPVVASSLLILIIPVALYLRKFGKAFAMALAVCITESQMAIGSMFLGIIAIYALKNERRFIFVISLLIIAVGIIAALWLKYPQEARKHISDKDRFRMWTEVVKDLKDPIVENSVARYPLTGYGMGSFAMIFPLKHKSEYGRFSQAHNDYVELLFNTGIIGIVLFLSAIGKLFKDNFVECRADREKRYLLGSFICIAICATGLFVFQLGAHAYFTVVILGLLNNKGGIV